LNIIVLDDNKEYLDILCDNLRNAGHEVHGTTDYDSALARLEQSRVDLFLLDVIMPNIDGLEIAEQLSNTNRNYCLIGISGGSEHFSAALGLKTMEVLGVDGILQKPFTIKSLMNKVSALNA
jgi:DNA-binding response OmpR family regulator